MPITVVCQGIVRFDKETGQYIRCGAEFQAPDSLAGKTMRCPTCGDDAPVPKGGTARTPPAPSISSSPGPVSPPPFKPATQRPPVTPPSPPPVSPADRTSVADGNSPWSAGSATAVGESAPEAGVESKPEAEDDLYSLSPLEAPPPGAHFETRQAAPPATYETTEHPLAAAHHVYQLGEVDEAPERAVHSGWCDRCGHDMPETATICAKCGYQHGMAHVVFRKEPTPPPSMQTCPHCNEQLPPGGLLCEACGFHSGLKQHFPALAKKRADDGQPPPTGLDQWVSRQVVGGGPSPKNAMLWVFGGIGLFVALIGVIVAGLLFLIFGPWALCMLVPLGFLLVAAMIGFFAFYRKNSAGVVDRQRKGAEQAIWGSMLTFMRMIGWRSPAPPFARYRTLDVRNTGFSDRDLAGLKELNEFEALDLEGTQVTDAGLPYLAAMPKLKFASVRKTQVTEQGAWNLQRAKPELWMWY